MTRNYTTIRVLLTVGALALGALDLPSQAGPKTVAELRAAANSHHESAEAAIAAWRALTVAAPKDGKAWYRLGYMLHMQKRYEEALSAHRLAFALGATPNAGYNVACALAMLDRPDEAVEALSAAIDKGFLMADHAREDADLRSLRTDERFIALIQRMRKMGAKTLEGRVKVAVLIFPGVELLDFAGPLEAFAAAHGKNGMAFDAFTVARSKEPMRTQGTQVVARYDFSDCPQPDIVVIPGGAVTQMVDHEPTIAWLNKVRPEVDLSMSVCNGAMALARLGALDGLRATTHWGVLPRLRELHPDVDVIEGARFIDAGEVVTAAGVSAGIDGALHVIERYCGRNVAAETARYMEYEWRPNRVGPYGLSVDTLADRKAIRDVVASLSGEDAAFEILDLQGEIAVVKLKTAKGIEYLRLAKDGAWKVRANSH